MDLSASMLAVARSRSAGQKITWQQGQAAQLPYAAGSFDLAACQQGLQFFTDRLAALQEMRRVLRKGGRAVVSAWLPLAENEGYARLFAPLARRLGVGAERIAPGFSLGGLRVLEDELRAAGFGRAVVERVERELVLEHPRPFIYRTLEAAAASLPGKEDYRAAVQAAVEEVEGSQLRAGVLRYPLVGAVAVANS